MNAIARLWMHVAAGCLCFNLAVATALLAVDFHRSLESFPARLDALVEREMDRTRAALAAQANMAREAAQAEIRETRGVLDRRLASIQDRAGSEIQETRKTADARLERIEGDLDLRLIELTDVADAKLRAATDSLTLIRADLKPLLDNSGSLSHQLAEAAPLWLDCDHNPDCAFNRYVGTARGVEQMSLAMGRHAEGQQAALERIATSTATGVEHLTKPTVWWKAVVTAPLRWLRIDVRR